MAWIGLVQLLNCMKINYYGSYTLIQQLIKTFMALYTAKICYLQTQKQKDKGEYMNISTKEQEGKE